MDNKMIFYGLCLMVFFYIGTIIGLVMWISSYAVLTGLYTKESAAIFPFIINTVLAFLRIFSIIPFGVDTKLKYSLIGQIIISLISLALASSNHIAVALYFLSCLIGPFVASIYGSIFVLSSQYGYRLEDHQLSRMATSGAFGEAILTPMIGILMGININMLYGTIALLGALMLLIRHYIVK